MRIVSQDGTIDVPYNDCLISVEPRFYDGAYICSIVHCNFKGNSIEAIANYSSPEKASKATGLLRYTYVNSVSHDHHIAPTVFRFPQDDEV